MVRLDEDVYELVKSKKREDETFSEAIDRLVDDWSLLDIAGTMTDEEAERHRELLERSEETARRDRRDLVDRLSSDEE